MAKQYVQNASGTITEAYSYEYDSLGRIIQSRAEDVNGDTIQRIQQLYDNANRLSAQHWEIQGDSYSESYTYDTGDGSLESMTTAGGQTLSYTYDFLKRHTATTVTNGSSTIFTVAKSYYNQTADTTLTTAQVQYYNVRNSAGTLIAGSQYVYDARGNITQIKESESPYRVLYAYEYDSLNQLTKETVYTYSGTSTVASSTKINTFTYDTAGNLLSVSENGVVKDEYTYGNSDWVDLLTKFNGTAISYDASGNPLNWYNGNTYSGLTWTMGRQLASLSMETDTENIGVSYTYDMSGIRSSKTVVVGSGTGGGDEGGIVVPGCDHEWVEINRTEYHIFYQCTKCSSTYQEPIQAPPTEYSLRSSSPTEYHEYIYASGRLMREIITTTANGTSTTEVLDFIYGSGSAPLALVYTNGTATPVTYYYVTNMQGDVVKLVTAGGTTVASYTYDAWGKVLSATGSMAEVNPIRYRGYYYDTETGFYYLQSRYYDPAVRRFVNADIQFDDNAGLIGANLYAYCANNPVAYKDTLGTSITVACIVIGAIVGLVAGAIGGSHYAEHKKGLTPDDGWEYWKYVAVGGAIGGAAGALGGWLFSLTPLAASASWAYYKATHVIGTTAYALGHAFEQWFYKAYNVVHTQVSHYGSRFDALYKGYIIDLKNYDWSKYKYCSSVISRFITQATKYMQYIGSEIRGMHIEGVIYIFSSRPPEEIIKVLEKIGVIVKWLP